MTQVFGNTAEDKPWYGEYIPLPAFVCPDDPDSHIYISDIAQALKEKVLGSFASMPNRIIDETTVTRKDYFCPVTGKERTGSIGWRAKFEWDEECPGLHLNPFKLDGK
jgi:hypothetical protein